jgi:hypothetical protein
MAHRYTFHRFAFMIPPEGQLKVKFIFILFRRIAWIPMFNHVAAVNDAGTTTAVRHAGSNRICHL